MLKIIRNTASSVVFIMCGWLLAGCTSRSSEVHYHDYDATIIPLVGTYRLMQLDGAGQEWSISLHNQPTSIESIDSIGIVSALIIGHSRQTYSYDTTHSPAWFIIAPLLKTEQLFTEAIEYKRALRKMKVADNKKPVSFLEAYIRQSKPVNWQAKK